MNSFAEWLQKMRHSALSSRTHEILRFLLILFPVLGIEESYRCQMTSHRGDLGAIGQSGGVIKSVVLKNQHCWAPGADGLLESNFVSTLSQTNSSELTCTSRALLQPSAFSETKESRSPIAEAFPSISR